MEHGKLFIGYKKEKSINSDLSYATGISLGIDRNMVAASVRDISWQQSAQDFLDMVTC